ncbi:MAG: hypothetical protein MZV70_37945 [Desulfobacterales bacterium]|nr:hypothetical protein [Desulfobacterales bacterium]
MYAGVEFFPLPAGRPRRPPDQPQDEAVQGRPGERDRRVDADHDQAGLRPHRPGGLRVRPQVRAASPSP